MEMCFYWLQDQETQKMIPVHWRAGRYNLGDYVTKHHPAKHHILVYPTYVTNNVTNISNMHSTTRV